jgi:6-phosphofructokinase 1
MKNLAILCSGGDAPGMNAAISSIYRASNYYNFNLFGIINGYDGMIDGKFIELNSSSVHNIIQRGGTILKSSRSIRFLDSAYRKIAFQKLKKKNIDGLIVLGGDGTFKGASIFLKEFDLPIIGVPCTIDNDLIGTDFCIGHDTAINTAMDAIDKIRDTAESHGRLFFVEVMGRDSGLIALRSGLAAGAEAVLIPETKMNAIELINVLKNDWDRDKSSMIVVVAEGDEEGGAYAISEKVKLHFEDLDVRITVLGHIQRGGKPSCMDRVLALRMGIGAVEALKVGKRNAMIGIVNDQLVEVSFDKIIKQKLEIKKELINLLEIMMDLK